ncbi:MAG: hypothetical protein R6W87_13495 [Halospina sp.]
MTKWIFSSEDERKTHHFEPEKNTFRIKKLSYLPQEGVGIHGSFYIKGNVVTRGDSLFVSAMGHTPPMELPEYKGAFDFYGSATLVSNGEVIARKRFKQRNQAVWPENEYAPIGSAKFYLAPSKDPWAYKVRIEAGYWFDSGAGTNSSSLAVKEIQIKGREQ